MVAMPKPTGSNSSVNLKKVKIDGLLTVISFDYLLQMGSILKQVKHQSE